MTCVTELNTLLNTLLVIDVPKIYDCRCMHVMVKQPQMILSINNKKVTRTFVIQASTHPHGHANKRQFLPSLSLPIETQKGSQNIGPPRSTATIALGARRHDRSQN